MNYPFWDINIGYGIIMAGIAIVHVFVSHFAIGGGLYLITAETYARKKNDSQWLDYLQHLSKFFVLLTVVFGALTGVGIWFIIGLLNPAATEVLIHNFLWAWATEWTFFIIEITSSILYFYGWKKMSPKNHMIIGWIYFIAAWMSLFVINGIITFMLTTGEWLTTGNIWDGFFNPTFWPSLALRTGVCIMLAGIYSMVIVSRRSPSDFRTGAVRFNAAWGLTGLAAALLSFYWYWRAIPSSVTDKALEMMATPVSSIEQSLWYAGGIALTLLLFGVLFPSRQRFAIALLTLALSMGWFGAFEWFRESIRKPYVISGYMYGNSIELSKRDLYEKEGYLRHIAFRTGNDGADLFRRSCRSCHTIDGYKPLKPAFDGTDTKFISGIIKGAHVIKGNMPPFLGTAEEAGKLAEYIRSRIDTRHMSEIYGLEGAELGKKVFAVRCGKCHVFGGYNDNSATMVGIAREDYNDLLEFSGEIADAMPPFTGDAAEKEAMFKYLSSMKNEAKK